MNTLIVSDVFEAYYDGRKGAFVVEGAKGQEASRPDEKRAQPANQDRRVAKAA